MQKDILAAELSGKPRKNPPAKQENRRCRFDSCVGKIPWKRAWQPTPVFLPARSHGQRSLVSYSSLCLKESDITEVTKYKHCTLNIKEMF